MSSGLGVNPRTLQEQSEWGGGCAGTNHSCDWSQFSCGFSARQSTCARGGVRQLSGQWISAKTDWVSVVWLALFQTLPATDCVKLVWHSGPLLHDGVHREHAKGGGRESWLDGFSTNAEECHYKQQSWHARTRGRRGQNCGRVAVDCFVPEGDRAKRWRQ